MMICNADFEELFPDLFQTEPDPAVQQVAGEPSVECIARWEDDGGRHLGPRAPLRCSAAVQRPAFDMERLARAGAIAAAAPAIATLVAAQTMLSAYGEMTTRQEIIA